MRMYSQRGNLLFPVRELYVPKVGKIMPVGLGRPGFNHRQTIDR